MNSLFTYYTCIEAACLMASLVFLRHERGSAWGMLRWYLGIVLLGELTALYWTWVLGHPANQWVYNLVMPAIAVFVGRLTFSAIGQLITIQRVWLYTWWWACAVAYGAEAWANGGLHVYLQHTRLFINMSISAGCFYYFILQLRAKEYRNVKATPEFWWIYGTCCFFFGQSIANQYIRLLAVTDTTIWGASLHTIIYIILISLLYGLWSYAFYLRHKQHSLAISS